MNGRVHCSEVLKGFKINLIKYLIFLGYLTLPYDIWTLQDRQELYFKFRTDMRTGTIFFGYGGPGIYTYIALIDGDLYFEFSNGIATGSVTYSLNNVGRTFCDGNWYDVVITKYHQQASITIVTDGLGTITTGDSSFRLVVLLVSDLYIGGVPEGSDAYYFIQTYKLNVPKQGMSGAWNVNVNFTQILKGAMS